MSSPAQRLHQRLVGKYGKAKALSILAQKLGRTGYFILKKQKPFVANQFFGDDVRDSRGVSRSDLLT